MTFRIAELLVNGMVMVIAADGAYRFDFSHIWRPCPGYHEVYFTSHLENCQNPIFGAVLTPGAIQLVQQIAALGCNGFKGWFENDAPDASMEIVMISEPHESTEL